MKVKANLITKDLEEFSRWDDIAFDPETHIVLDVTEVPDMENERLNDTNDGIRPCTALELRPLSVVKAEKLKEANDKCDETLKAITDLYSASERETWVIQELEASNFQHDMDNLVEPKRATPNLDWIIEEKDGLPVDDAKRQALATRILTKAIAFHQFSSLTVGKRHKMTEAVELAFADAEAAIAAAITLEEAEAAELAGIAALEAIVFQ